MNVTIKRIAEMAGVSTAAVSRALNGHTDIGEATRKRIHAISARLGYTPNAMARNLVKKSSDTVGLLIPDISTPIYPEIFKGLDYEVKKRGCKLFLCDTNRDIEMEKSYVKTLMENRARGIIIAPVSGRVDHIKEMTRERIPLVFIGGKVNAGMGSYVATDNRLGSRLAVEHLAGLGHSFIRMFCDNPATKTKRDRIAGYRSAMRERGLEARVHCAERHYQTGLEYGCAQARLVFDSGEPLTAVYCSSDLVALGVMQAAAERGLRIPDDLSLIGYDDIMFASLPTIMLTTVAQPKFEIGALAAELLFTKIERSDDKGRSRRIVKPSLVVRGTCRSLVAGTERVAI